MQLKGNRGSGPDRLPEADVRSCVADPEGQATVRNVEPEGLLSTGTRDAGTNPGPFDRIIVQNNNRYASTACHFNPTFTLRPGEVFVYDHSPGQETAASSIFMSTYQGSHVDSRASGTKAPGTVAETYNAPQAADNTTPHSAPGEGETDGNVITTPTFRPEAFGEGAQVAQPSGSRREVTTPEPHKAECFKERDPATGETRIVERLTYRNTYNAMSENPRAFGAGAAVLVGETVIDSLVKNLDPGLQAAIISGKFDYGQYMAEQRLKASGQATGSTANVPSQATANGMNSSQTTNNFDQSSIGIDQTTISLFGDQIDSSAQRPVPGDTPWTESQFTPRSLQAPEEAQGGMSPPPTTTESSEAGSDVLNLAGLEEEGQKLGHLIEEAEDELNEFLNAQEARVIRLKEVKRLIENLDAGGTGEIESLPIPLHCAPASATPASSTSETEDQETVQTC